MVRIALWWSSSSQLGDGRRQREAGPSTGSSRTTATTGESHCRCCPDHSETQPGTFLCLPFPRPRLAFWRHSTTPAATEREPAAHSAVPVRYQLRRHVLARIRRLFRLCRPQRTLTFPRVRFRLRESHEAAPQLEYPPEQDDALSRVTVLTRGTSADYDAFGPVLSYRMRTARRRNSV